MNKTTTWHYTGDDTPVDIELQQVNTLTYRNLTVPVWQVAPGQGNYYPGPFVRHADMPSKLAEAFYKWQFSAQIPFSDAAYVYDFTNFIERTAP
jgi:hypothetical protein